MKLKPQSLKVTPSKTIYANQDALDAILRNDFVAFIEKVCETLNGEGTFKPNWHIEILAYVLLRTIAPPEERRTRLALHLPPRHLKSIIISIAWPAWVLGREPNMRIVCVSHTADLSADLHRKFRMIIESDWYQRVFPETVAFVKKNTETEFETGKSGGRLAISVGASITGRGGDMIIIDDPMKAEHAYNELEEAKIRTFFDQSLSTRLNNKKTGVIILTMQRLSPGDLGAHVADDSAWKCYSFPAIAEETMRFESADRKISYRRVKGEALHAEHEDIPEFEELKRRLGTEGFLAQYQQAPIPRGGGMILWEWFNRYDRLPPRGEWELSFHSWDCAASIEEAADFSVWQHWVYAEERFYLVDMLRRKMRYPDTKRCCFEFIDRDDPDHVLIEFASTGLALGPEVYQRYPLREQKRRVPLIKPRLSKEDRVAFVSPLIEAGRVLLPRQASFLPAFEAEMRAFPEGDHDDQVDAMSQALWYFKVAYENRTKDFWKPLSREARRQAL